MNRPANITATTSRSLRTRRVSNSSLPTIIATFAGGQRPVSPPHDPTAGYREKAGEPQIGDEDHHAEKQGRLSRSTAL